MGATRVGDLLDLWRDRHLAGRDLAPSTVTRHRWAVDLWRAQIGGIRLRALTVEDVERGLDRIGAGVDGVPLARASLVKVRGTLGAVLDYGVRRRMVAGNVARIADLPGCSSGDGGCVQ